MESLKSQIENVEGEPILEPIVKSYVAVDRATIGKTEAERLSSWSQQVLATTKGFINLSKSDLVNFLIRDHKPELTAKEIGQLRQLHYDPIKHMNWITQQLKAAIANGDTVGILNLQSEISKIEVKVVHDAQTLPEENEIGLPQEVCVPIRKRRKKAEMLLNETSDEAPLKSE